MRKKTRELMKIICHLRDFGHSKWNFFSFLRIAISLKLSSQSLEWQQCLTCHDYFLESWQKRYNSGNIQKRWILLLVILWKTCSGYDRFLRKNGKSSWLDFFHVYFEMYWWSLLKISASLHACFYTLARQVNECFFDAPCSKN